MMLGVANNCHVGFDSSLQFLLTPISKYALGKSLVKKTKSSGGGDQDEAHGAAHFGASSDDGLGRRRLPWQA
jgi:hypothetical protein